MPPSESQILLHFLLPPAALSAVLTLRKFTELFPPSLQSSPQIPVLYRELQHQRAIDVDDVKTNISNEVKKGEWQRRHVARARRRKEGEEEAGLAEDPDIGMEVELFGPSKYRLPDKPHSLETVRAEMTQACEDLEDEIAAIEAQAATILDDIKTTVDELSDLRYGRFQRVSGVEDDPVSEVIDGLTKLESLCAPVQRDSNAAG